jgi:leucyl-tRNA synthetase
MLEQAGREKNIVLITAEIRTFLDKLWAIIKKYTPRHEETGNNESIVEDRSFLQEKLSVIKSACEVYDRKAIKAAIAELRQKEWLGEVRELMTKMEDNLLNGDFEALLKAAGKGTR